MLPPFAADPCRPPSPHAHNTLPVAIMIPTAPHRPRLHRYKDSTGYLLFRGIIFISIFANPRPEMRAAVATFQKEQLGPRYVAVHLRKLEPLTVAFLKDVRRRGQEGPCSNNGGGR